MRRKRLAGLAALAAVCVATLIYFGQVPAAAAFDNTRWGANYFPNVELTDQFGNKFHFYDDLIKGKIVAIDLIYTHCTDACPLETARLVQVQKLLGDRVGKEIFFYSITIDPKRDTPEVLNAYAEKFHVGPGWLFLTGKAEDIELVSKKLGLYSDPDPSNRDGHTPSLVLGNEATGQWMRNSATDNARFLSVLIGDRLDQWKRNLTAPARSYSEAEPLKLNAGEYLFQTHCAACHTVGQGDKIGPDLKGVTSVRDRAWLMRFIQVPDQMLAGKDALATELFKKYKEVQMPNLRLGDVDTARVIEYIEKKSAAVAPAKAPANPGNNPAEKIGPTEPEARNSGRQ
ncbi:MAG TPA: SCO family protein [Candidatus Angelobacter sp.]